MVSKHFAQSEHRHRGNFLHTAAAHWIFSPFWWHQLEVVRLPVDQQPPALFSLSITDDPISRQFWRRLLNPSYRHWLGRWLVMNMSPAAHTAASAIWPAWLVWLAAPLCYCVSVSELYWHIEPLMQSLFKNAPLIVTQCFSGRCSLCGAAGGRCREVIQRRLLRRGNGSVRERSARCLLAICVSANALWFETISPSRYRLMKLIIWNLKGFRYLPLDPRESSRSPTIIKHISRKLHFYLLSGGDLALCSRRPAEKTNKQKPSG